MPLLEGLVWMVELWKTEDTVRIDLAPIPTSTETASTETSPNDPVDIPVEKYATAPPAAQIPPAVRSRSGG